MNFKKIKLISFESQKNITRLENLLAYASKFSPKKKLNKTVFVWKINSNVTGVKGYFFIDLKRSLGIQ